MGNKQGLTTFKGGSVLIKLDNQHYQTGQRVTGSVSFVLDKPYPADKLTLELTGTEQAIWEGSDDKHKNPKYSGMICMKSTVLRLSQVLASFPEGLVTTGSKVFPFAIQLPTDLPPSFLYLGKDNS